MSSDPELYKKLIDDDDDVENPTKATLVAAEKPSTQSRHVPCLCKWVMIIMAVFTALGLLGGAFTYMRVKDVVEHLTVTVPAPKFPVVDMTDAELELVKDRVKMFVDELVAGRHPSDDLVVTQDEINGFIGHSDYLRGNMLVTLKKNAIKEEYSLPVQFLPGGKGRYFVGHDYLVVKKDMIEMEMETAATHEDWFDGPLFFAQLQYLVTKNKYDEGKTMLELFLEKGSFFGQEAPQDFIDQRKNLLEDLYHGDDEDSEHVKAVLEGIELVAIEDGMIVVKPRKE